MQGGIAAVAGQWALTRPVTDSFAIVKVDQLAGVRVYANNQPVGEPAELMGEARRQLRVAHQIVERHVERHTWTRVEP